MIGTSLLFSGSIAGLLGPGDFATPTVGYSLRPLSVSYSGAVVRVRRSGDHAEKDFNSTSITNGTLDDFLITLGTDDHSKEILSDFEDIPDFSLLCACNVGRANELDAVDEFNDADGFVSKWYDQFGSNDATNSTEAEQPKIWDASTGLVTEDGKAAILLDGVDDHLVSISVYPTQQYQSSFYVASSTGTNNRVLDTRGTGATGTVQGWQHKFSNNQDVTLIDNGAGIGLILSNVSRTGQNLISSFIYGGSGSYIIEYTNSSLSDTATDVNNIDFDSGNSLYIGANVNGADSQLFGGKIQEIILYASDQSANRTKIEDNINDYYDIY